MDLVIPFENLAVGWATVCLRTGLSSRLARTHQTVHRHYSRYYDQTTKRLVADMCAADIRAYGYRFRMLSQQSTLLDEARYRFAKTYSFARGTAARVKRLETVLRKTPTGV